MTDVATKDMRTTFNILRVGVILLVRGGMLSIDFGVGVGKGIDDGWVIDVLCKVISGQYS